MTVVGIPVEALFFVALTIQRAAPPAARVEGTGADAAAAVRKRSVRFDAEKFVPTAATP